MASYLSTEQPIKFSQETESLVKRLAGPSSGKAGLAKDQTEINRIISDASKGSKFYENEKKKDKELTIKINRILKQRDEAINGVDIAKIEAAVDQMINKIESQRDLTQIIVHVDMDAFYASVELLDNPDLKGKPFAVGKGVLTTASYDARKYGVRSGMAGFIAKKLCPELIFIPNHFARYSEMSSKVMEIFHRYDPDMCPAGCDEGYLNITLYCEEHSMTAEECVKEMRETVFRETKLTVSAGIAPNKMLAKICSDKNKPNGQFQLEFDSESIKSFMHDLSIRKVPGIGRVNERLLDAIGIKTCGDIYTQRAVLSLMDKQFGLVFLLRTYLGIASNTVEAYRREERKSIGAERTFPSLRNIQQIHEKLAEVADELERDMEENGWAGRTVTLKFKLNTYQVFTRAKSLNHWVTKKEELFEIGKELLAPELPVTIRLIGLRVTKLKDLRDTGTNGIKRFFEPASKNGSPRKRAKLSNEELEDHDYMEEAMPGYHEHDETDYKLEDDSFEGDEIIDLTNIQENLDTSISPSRRPPHSTSNAHASASDLGPPSRPRSNSEAKPFSPKSIKAVETHECPICSKTLETDNQGLNAHVDFCLSRGAIMEAQGSATKIIKSTATYKGWPKPEPRKKFNAKPENPKKPGSSKRGK
uniref:DNA polymerase kappa n=1 Tax=Psilocybe cubensis TaxID=181762 RepID=A0A8H8CPL3_PSICU